MNNISSNHVSFIDCFAQTPVHTCVNDFITRTNTLSTYHMVSQYGFRSLEQEPPPLAYIILGSASHVSERLPWHSQLASVIDKKLKNNIPVLGICFGHQLMADYYGCHVDYIDNSHLTLKEVRQITLDQSIYGIANGETFNLAYCHSQVVKEINSDFESIAHSPLFENEIIKHKNLPFIGIQAHPEASLNFLENETEACLDERKKAKSDGDLFLDYFISSLK